METLKRVLDDVREAFGMEPKYMKLSPFQEAKLLHEFRTFYDMNGDGRLQWKDFEMARDYVCEKSGWKPKSSKWNVCRLLFADLWRHLLDAADGNIDGEVTKDEWLFLWTKIIRDKRTFDHGRGKKCPPKPPETEDQPSNVVPDKKENAAAAKEAPSRGEQAQDDDFPVPQWFENYIEYKFSLLDRAGDGILDEEEFEYTLNDAYNISPKDCQTAFRLMTKNGEMTIDKRYFRTLALQFYLSNDPSDLGNFINGKLIYDD